jgi:hypothetical protein
MAGSSLRGDTLGQNTTTPFGTPAEREISGASTELAPGSSPGVLALGGVPAAPPDEVVVEAAGDVLSGDAEVVVEEHARSASETERAMDRMRQSNHKSRAGRTPVRGPWVW